MVMFNKGPLGRSDSRTYFATNKISVLFFVPKAIITYSYHLKLVV